MRKIVKPLNPEPDGTCRTIKAQYEQTSQANFSRGNTFGATGVIVNFYETVFCIQQDKDMQNDAMLTHSMVARINRKTRDIEYFGIRKLTPRECFRLMDVDDADFDKLLATDENGKRLLSNSNLYKLAGNSIVVNCLACIYKQIWQPDERYKAGEQMTLF